jgi:hypothetical protein
MIDSTPDAPGSPCTGHKLETADSDRYDKSTHDRLTAAATSYVEQYARSFGDAPSDWSIVEGHYVFSACGDGERVRPFETILNWHASFRPGASMKFPTVPVRVERVGGGHAVAY